MCVSIPFGPESLVYGFLALPYIAIPDTPLRPVFASFGGRSVWAAPSFLRAASWGPLPAKAGLHFPVVAMSA